MAESIQVKVQAVLDKSTNIVQELTEQAKVGAITVANSVFEEFNKRIRSTKTLLEAGAIDDAATAVEKLSKSLTSFLSTLDPAIGGLAKQLTEYQNQLQEVKRLREAVLNQQAAKSAPYVETKSGMRYATDYAQKHFAADVSKLNKWGLNIPSNWNPYGLANTLNATRKNVTSDNVPKSFKGTADEFKEALKSIINKLGYEAADTGSVKLSGEVQKEYEAAIKDTQTSLSKLDEQIVELTQHINDINDQINKRAKSGESGEAAPSTPDAGDKGEAAPSTPDAGDKGEAPDEKAATYPAVDRIRELNAARDDLANTIDKEAEATRRAEAQARKQKAADEDRAAATVDYTKTAEESIVTQNKQTNAVGRAVTTFFGYQMVLRQLRKLWNTALHTLQELDKQLTNQAIVTNLTREQTWKLVQTYQELGKATGFTTTQIANVTTEYLRQGNSIKDALILTEAAAKAAQVAGISATDSVKYLTTALHGFKLEAEDALDVSDKFAALAAKSASNYEDLAIALSKVASQAQLAGMSMDYTLALLTTGLDVTQEAPESIGTALKTVIARMREISDYGETLTDGTNINQVERALSYVNIELRNTNGALRSSEDVLDELGRKWETLSANQQAAVAKALAGTRQQSRLVAILDNYEEVLKYQEIADLAIGATNAQMQEYLEGMEASMNRLHVQYEEFIKSITNNDVIIGIVNFLTDRLEKITKLLKNPAGLIAVITTALRLMMTTVIPNIIGRLTGVVQKIITSQTAQNKVNEAFEAGRQKILGTTAAYGVLLDQMRQAGILTDKLNDSAKAKGTLRLSAPGETATTDDALKHFQRHRATTAEGQLKGTATNPALRSAVSKGSKNFEAVLQKQTKLIKKQEDSIEAEIKQVGVLRKKHADVQVAAEATEEQKKAAEDADVLLAEKQRQLADESIMAEERLRIAKASSWNEDMQRNAEVALEEAKKDLKEKQAALAKAEGSDEEKAKAQELVDKAEAEVQAKTRVVALGREELAAKANGGATTDMGGDPKQKFGEKLGKGMGKAMGAVAAVSTAIQWGTEIFDIATNGLKKKAEEAVEKSQQIQNELYNNRKLQSTFDSLIKSTDELNSKFVKTAEDLEQLRSNREELIAALAEDGDTLAYERMKDEELYEQARMKRDKLMQRNQELIQDMNDALFGAANDWNFGEAALNFAGKTAAGAAVGAAFGPWGALIGAGVGSVVAIVEESIKGVQAANARGKVQELIQTEEGLAQVKTLIQYQYQSTIDQTTELGRAQAEAVESAFSSIITNLDSDQMKAVLEKYNYNTYDFATKLRDTLEGVSSSLYLLSEDGVKYADQIAAAKKVLAAAVASGDQAVIEVVRARYGQLLDMETVLGEQSIKYIDALGVNANYVADVANKLKDVLGADNTQGAIEEFLRVLSDPDHTIDDITKATEGWGESALAAAAQVRRAGQTVQGVAEQMTTINSQIQGIRDMQSNWGNKTVAERQAWITENADFFNNPTTGEWDQNIYNDFINGSDISPYIIAYTKKKKEEMKQAGHDLVEAAEIEMQGVETAIQDIEAQMATMDTSSEEYKLLAKQLEDYKKKLAALNAERAEGLALEQEAAHLGELTLAQVVDKQNEQISKLKEMYEAEEKALTDSLQKRKEAYQKYFDSLSSQEAAADYAENRDQIIESISRLSAGTDATSRNKVAELRKQLSQIEKEEANRKTEEARQQVLQNIDDQVSTIEESFDKLLSNNQELLASMDENTKAQYLQYLATLGLTGEDLKLRTQELSDLLDGIWTKNGLQNRNNVVVDAISTPQSPTTEQDPQSVMNLTIGNQTEQVTLTQAKMKDLIQQMFTWLNANAGTHFKV